MAEALDIRTLVNRVITFGVVVAFVCAVQATVAHAVEAEPHLDSISVSAAAPGTPVTLRGTGFGTPHPTSYATFNGVRAEIVTWTDTEVVAKVPTRAVAGYAGVTVANNTSNGLWFAPKGRPQVTAVSSVFAPPGSSVTFFGTGFGSTQRSGWVTFGGVRAPVAYWSDTRVVAVVPEVTDICYAGLWQDGAPSNGVLFMAFLPPRIEEASHDRVQPGTTVRVKGRRFGPRAKGHVRIGDSEVSPLSWTDTEIVFEVPDGAPSGYVGVTHNGASSNGVYLSVVPKLESLSAWWVEPGSRLSIEGSGFTVATRVTVAGRDALIVSRTDTTIEIEVPDDAEEGYIRVWNGSAVSNGLWLLPIHPSRIDPLGATTASPTDAVTITGAHFGAAGPDSSVRLGGQSMTVLEWTDTRIRAIVPEGAESGYIGVWKRSIASNGRWLTIIE